MQRAAWLKRMQAKAEALYDHFAPLYWIEFGLSATETHEAYLQAFLEQVPSRSRLLSAACGAGRFDGVLLEAGHTVVGVDQSAGMLDRAREHFPQVRYLKMSLQEMSFWDPFDGAICVDAMEHVCPEDWPGILRNLWEALKPGAVLYLTANVAEAEPEAVARSYQRAQAQGLPVVFGEVADRVEEGYDLFMAYPDVRQIPEEMISELADVAVYHYYPPLAQVRAWLAEAGFVIALEGPGIWYQHFLVRRVSPRAG